MADKKISALTAASTPLAGTEVLPIVQGGATVKVAVSNLTAGRAVAASSMSVTGVGAGIVLTQSDVGNSTYYVMDTTVETGGKRWRFGYSGATTFSNFSFLNVTDNVTALNLASNGIVTMSAYGAGAATFSAAGVISSVSDETWKIKDGVPSNPDEMLKKLEPGYWYYNDEKKEVFGAERQLGFYAQNVHVAIGSEAAPTPTEITMPDDTGTQIGTGKFRPWGYYDRSVLAVTVMSLQKALAAIETLEAKVAALEARTI
jgi:hypothetical protein